MVKTYLTRGLLVGLAAGAFAFGFAKLVGEPQIGRAERFEHSVARQLGETPPPELVSRTVQSTAGLATGVLVAGVGLGGLYALVFAATYRRFTAAGPRPTAALLAACGFVAVFLVPFLKYPANPPSAGDPDTIGQRTAVYFLLVLFSVLSVILAASVRSLLVPRLGAWNGTVLAALSYVGLVIVAYLVMPGTDPVPAAFPATALWRFRLASVGVQAVLWATLGIGFGALTERREATP